MNGIEIALGILIMIISLVIIVVVLMQQSRQAGLSGAIAGGSETFFGKNKGRTVDAKLAKITKILSAVFFVLSLAATLILAYITAKG